MASPAATFNVSDKSTPGYYGASQTAFLLLDFHTMLVEKAVGPNGTAAAQVAAEMRTWAKAHGMPVIHCLVDLHGSPFPTCKDSARFEGAISTMQTTGSGVEASQLLSGSNDADVTFTRRPGHISALTSPGVLEYLREKDIKSLVLAGLSTSGCVMRTALASADAEYVVTVLSDGCADSDQAVHDMMVEKIFTNRGYVATAAEFRSGFEAAKAEK